MHARTSTSPSIQRPYISAGTQRVAAAAALNIVAGTDVSGAAVEVDTGPRRTQQAMT